MENVEGLAKGAAVDYLNKVYDKFKSIGYQVRCYLLKGEEMGVPQKRHRVFFIATKDLSFNYNNLDMNFNYEPVTYGTIRTSIGEEITGVFGEWSKFIKFGDKDLSDVGKRQYNRPNSFFNYNIVYDNEVSNCVTAHHTANNISYETKHWQSKEDIIYMQTFPTDYNFMSNKTTDIKYVCGMSVPPIMTKRIVERMIKAEMF